MKVHNKEDADLSSDEISNINNKFDEEMRVFLQPSPEVVMEEIKEEESCRSQEEEHKISEQFGEFVPASDMSKEGALSYDVVEGYSEASYSENLQVMLKSMSGWNFIIYFQGSRSRYLIRADSCM